MAPIATSVPEQTSPEDLKQKVHQSLANLPKTALDRVWRGNREGTVRLHGRPDFQGDKYAERQWIKEHMVTLSLMIVK